ncbi:MAG: EamA family transporter [Candidatus Lokiarchaeota archaeon]|nr:EamA family transporter [Candidatus Lokiarchaeota archaeon]
MSSSESSKTRSLAVAVLIITTVLWGTTFIITKNVTKEVPIFLYLSLRFLIALIGFTPIFFRLKHINKKIIWMGAVAGLIYYLAITTQTIGLQTTSAGKTGFITGLNTVIVPFIVWLGFKKPVGKNVWVAVILSIIGMGLLLLEGDSGVLIGDILVLFCAFFCALFIVFNDKYVRLVDVYLYTIVQLATIFILCLMSSLILREEYNIIASDISFWLVMLYMGIGVTTFTFIFQNWGQKHIDPSQTAIIFTLEPVFAVLFASFLIGDEILSWQAWIGCGLIFIAILIVAIKKKELENLTNIE